MTLRRDFLAFTAGAVVAKTVLPIAARAETPPPLTAVVPADRDELLERYSAWLEAERLALMREMYPDLDCRRAARFVPDSAFVHSTALNLGPPPSSRMQAVLEAAGVWTGPDTLEARQAVLGGPQASSAPHPDAELLALCAEFDGLMRRYLATDFELAGNHTPEAQAEAAKQAEYLDAADRLVDRMCELRATTREGAAARARSLTLADLELMKEGTGDVGACLTAAIVRDLIGGAA